LDNFYIAHHKQKVHSEGDTAAYSLLPHCCAKSQIGRRKIRNEKEW